MAYCRYCGAEVRSSDTFCFKCGRSLEIQPTNYVPTDTRAENAISTGIKVDDVEVRRMDVIIDPVRIIVLSILSFGLYFYYWFYLTWKHYRDYTGTENFPFWHALTLFVPIYFLFRVHAHVRSFKELMVEGGMTSSLRPGVVVALILLSNLLSIISWRFYYDDSLSNAIVLDIIVVLLNTGLLFWVQTNLNLFWKVTKYIFATNAHIGVGEVIFVLVGILAWIGTFLP